MIPGGLDIPSSFHVGSLLHCRPSIRLEQPAPVFHAIQLPRQLLSVVHVVIGRAVWTSGKKDREDVAEGEAMRCKSATPRLDPLLLKPLKNLTGSAEPLVQLSSMSSMADKSPAEK